MKYDLPIFMINEPAYYEVSVLEKDEGVINFTEQKLNLKFRCTSLQKEFDLSCKNTIQISVLKNMIIEQANLKNQYQIEDLRLFFSGKELKNMHYLGSYRVKDDVVIQCCFATKNCD